MRINKPKLPLNSTPVRARQPQGGYHPGQGLTPTRQHENGMYVGNVSPNKLNATKKPLAQKGPQTQQMPYLQLNQRRESQPTQPNRPLAMLSKRAVNQCKNHADKEGIFKIFIDDEMMYYCHQCSNRLATQGFSLQKIVGPGEINIYGVSNILSSRRQSYTAQAPMVFQPPPPPNPAFNIQNFRLQIDPSLSQDPRFLELQQFVNQCKETMTSFDQNLQGFQEIEGHYADQQQLIEQFYDALIDYIGHIKGEHLNLIKNESKKYIQIADIESSQLQENKEDIQGMVKDISECVNDIVSNIDEESFNSCMNSYRQKVELYKHRVEEQRATFDEVTKYDQKELENKLQEFRVIVNDLFNVKESKGRPIAREMEREPSTTRMGNMNNMNNLNNLSNLNNMNNMGMGNVGNIGAMNGMNNFRGTSRLNGMNNGFGGGGVDDGFGVNGVLGGNARNNAIGATIPKANTNGPFRTLFGDDGTAQSPQFKDI